MAMLSAWWVRLLAAALVLGGLSAGIYFAVQAGGDSDEPPQGARPQSAVEFTATATAAPPTRAAPDATATPPQPTAPPATPIAPIPTPDTRIPILDLPTLDQIELGPDGKYFIADRGDGCTWSEALRLESESSGEEVILRTDCPSDFQILFRPDTGEIFIVIS